MATRQLFTRVLGLAGVVAASLLVSACGGADEDATGDGGGVGNGAAGATGSTGGSGTAGTTAGKGGTVAGGGATQGKGGASAGGEAQGGQSVGGSSQGGQAQGGQAQGGTAQGGTSQGGGGMGAAGGCQTPENTPKPDCPPGTEPTWNGGTCHGMWFCTSQGMGGAAQGGSGQGGEAQGGQSAGGSSSGCCAQDTDCADGATCLLGACQPKLQPGQCYADNDCGNGFYCADASLCGCGAACQGPTTAGVCAPVGIVCCQDDGGCAAANPDTPRCVKGLCLAKAPDGGCWEAQDCAAGEACEGGFVCACGLDCQGAEQPGKCVPPASGCCDAAQGCGPGEVCAGNVCKPQAPDGACWSTDDCAAGEICSGNFVCPCGALCGPAADSMGKCIPKGPGCCATGADCANGETCAVDMCKALPNPGTCWTQLDCGFGQTCEGGFVCPCGAVCDGPDTLGKCVDVAPGCCVSDADCAVSAQGPLCVNGVCKPVIDSGCWRDADCGAGETCEGEFVCQCGALCGPFADTPGKCAATSPDKCCKGDVDCAKGERCEGDVCKAIPDAGTCWSVADCASGQSCEGGFVCPCNGACFAPDSLGKCIDPTVGCCSTDKDCVASAGGGECVNGVCKPVIDSGCWRDADCGAGETCEGELVCQCGALCGPAADTPGKCVAVNPGQTCCKASADCPNGEACEGDVCKPLPKAGTCWTSGDCNAGQACEGAFVCPCGAACFAQDQLGKCVDVGAQVCCKTSDECKQAGLFECVNAVCKEAPPVGGCWSDADCGALGTCSGEQVCACGAACFVADQPGKCVF